MVGALSLRSRCPLAPPPGTFGGEVFMGFVLGVDLWKSYPVPKGLGVKYSFHWGYRAS
jgi:hypothetical protein